MCECVPIEKCTGRQCVSKCVASLRDRRVVRHDSRCIRERPVTVVGVSGLVGAALADKMTSNVASSSAFASLLADLCMLVK